MKTCTKNANEDLDNVANGKKNYLRCAWQVF